MLIRWQWTLSRLPEKAEMGLNDLQVMGESRKAEMNAQAILDAKMTIESSLMKLENAKEELMDAKEDATADNQQYF